MNEELWGGLTPPLPPLLRRACCSEENTCYNEVHHSPPYKEIKHIHASAADLLHTLLEYEISIGANVDTAKTKRKK